MQGSNNPHAYHYGGLGAKAAMRLERPHLFVAASSPPPGQRLKEQPLVVLGRTSLHSVARNGTDAHMTNELRRGLLEKRNEMEMSTDGLLQMSTDGQQHSASRWLTHQDHEGCSPLYLAAKFNSVRCMQLLIVAGRSLGSRVLQAMLTAPHAQNGETPLHAAVWRGSEHSIRALLGLDDEDPHVRAAFKSLSLTVRLVPAAPPPPACCVACRLVRCVGWCTALEATGVAHC